jgi:D-cysteine desulfhydrase
VADAADSGGPALLAARSPALAALPRVALGNWPTPLAAAPALGAALGQPALWLKHDGRAARGYGGNKVRKLEYLLGAARQKGCDAVVTFGAAGSNHVLATALHAAELGLRCHAVLTDQPRTAWVGDTLRWHALLGTTLHASIGFADSARIAAALRAGHATGPDALCEIPWGGSSPVGALGFIAAGLELAAQCRARSVAPGAGAPQAVYVPLGTMGTAVGLALGLRLAGLATPVIAVQVVPAVVASGEALARLAADTTALLASLDPTASAAGERSLAIEHREEFFGAGYAVPTTAASEVVSKAAGHGLFLETTYSGKALAAVAADAGRYDPAGGPVVFWLTGNAQPRPPELKYADTMGIPAAFRHYVD